MDSCGRVRRGTGCAAATQLSPDMVHVVAPDGWPSHTRLPCHYTNLDLCLNRSFVAPKPAFNPCLELLERVTKVGKNDVDKMK